MLYRGYGNSRKIAPPVERREPAAPAPGSSNKCFPIDCSSRDARSDCAITPPVISPCGTELSFFCHRRVSRSTSNCFAGLRTCVYVRVSHVYIRIARSLRERERGSDGFTQSLTMLTREFHSYLAMC